VQPPQLLGPRTEPVLEDAADRARRALFRRSELTHLLQRQRRRLLDHHVHPGLERLDREWPVAGRRRTDDDGVDVAARQGILQRSGGPAHRPPPGELLRPIGVEVDSGDQTNLVGKG
jgi:hypothetical protein